MLMCNILSSYKIEKSRLSTAFLPQIYVQRFIFF